MIKTILGQQGEAQAEEAFAVGFDWKGVADGENRGRIGHGHGGVCAPRGGIGRGAGAQTFN